MATAGFTAEASLYRTTRLYGTFVSVAYKSASQVITPTSLPTCNPPQGELCGFGSGPPYDFAYCCPSGHVCCNPSCLPGSLTCVGCCPKNDPQCCRQPGPQPGPSWCTFPFKNCGVLGTGPGAHFACCSAREKCCNAASHLCCDLFESCCGNKCCAIGQVCTDPASSTCCGRVKVCGSKCCGDAEQCIDGECRVSCGGIFCDPGDTCVNGICCAPQNICGNSCCTSGQTCQGGVCKCPGGLLNDNLNCGQCGNVCTSGQTCQGGICKCSSGVLNDKSNCGMCGLACGGTKTICCGGVCSDLTSDPVNCGACGRVCSPGASCCKGTTPGGGCCPAGTVCVDFTGWPGIGGLGPRCV